MKSVIRNTDWGIMAMNASLEDMAILRLPEVKQLVGLGKSSIYRMMDEGYFPRRVNLGSRAVGWRAGDVRAWLQSRMELREAPARKARRHP